MAACLRQARPTTSPIPSPVVLHTPRPCLPTSTSPTRPSAVPPAPSRRTTRPSLEWGITLGPHRYEAVVEFLRILSQSLTPFPLLEPFCCVIILDPTEQAAFHLPICTLCCIRFWHLFHRLYSIWREVCGVGSGCYYNGSTGLFIVFFFFL